MSYDSDDRDISSWSSARDPLTSLSQAEAEADQFAHIVENSLHEIYIFDADTLVFVQANFGARKNMGYSNSEFRALTPVDIKPEMTRESFETLISPLRDKRERLLVFTTIHRRKDGTTYPVEVHLQLVQTGARAVFVAIIQDITEKLQTEERLRQAQKMEAIGQLTGGIAHDFNNLLTVILGNSELLSGRIAGDVIASRLLNEMIAAAESGASLTQQLLAFARQMPLEPQVLNIENLIDDMTDLLTRALGETIELRTKLAADLGQTMADPAQTQNAVFNLAINARDAMPDGGCLTIETANVALGDEIAAQNLNVEPGEYVRLTVSDNGQGMAADLRSRAMDPFFTTKEQGKGTGLGLSMVHGFAKQSGGHLEIDSEPGRGTSVSLYLPITDRDGDVHPADVRTKPTGVIGTQCVLVVEDDARVRKVSVTRLRYLGFQVVEAANGQQALDLLDKPNTIDIVFTDMVMPGGLSGADLLREVQHRYPHIKRLITSGYAEDGVLPNDGTIFLPKPCSLNDMSKAFEQLLGDPPAPGSGPHMAD